MTRGWRNESHRHSLSAKGIKTVPRKKFMGSRGVWVASPSDLDEPWRLTRDEFQSYTVEVHPEAFDEERFQASAFILPTGEYVYVDEYTHRHYIGGYENGWIRKSSIGLSGTPTYEVKGWSRKVADLILDDILSFKPVERYISIDIGDRGKGYGFSYNALWQNDFSFNDVFRDHRTDVVEYISNFDEATVKSVRITSHRNIVRYALHDGEPVPKRVLVDYPELLEGS
ncbi:MAG: hypothetical protein ACTSPB_00210 [Candidatus Thorarchaeota archaeon]